MKTDIKTLKILLSQIGHEAFAIGKIYCKFEKEQPPEVYDKVESMITIKLDQWKKLIKRK